LALVFLLVASFGAMVCLLRFAVLPGAADIATPQDRQLPRTRGDIQQNLRPFDNCAVAVITCLKCEGDSVAEISNSRL
jgi:hypothetical protein